MKKKSQTGENQETNYDTINLPSPPFTGEQCENHAETFVGYLTADNRRRHSRMRNTRDMTHTHITHHTHYTFAHITCTYDTRHTDTKTRPHVRNNGQHPLYTRHIGKKKLVLFVFFGKWDEHREYMRIIYIIYEEYICGNREGKKKKKTKKRKRGGRGE